ncbi:MAG: PKD domain-containing protein, partial [Actinobacteria bacterium]|nr:PKD domain-containing protein [Actinomycetota bacterium]
TYEHALKGMSAQVPEGRLNALRHDPRVKYVEEVREHSIDAQQVPTGISRIFATGNERIGIAGDGGAVDVDVAVIDTGIDREHPDLDVIEGITCLSTTCSGNGDDDHYHGTHVAGTIAALDNGTHVVGVAPGARLYAVKVLNRRGSGTTDGIIAGIDWVTARADTIEVANMSLGGPGFSQAEYDAIQGAVDAGVAFAVAAGNDDDDANNYSPGGFDNVLSVSALVDFNGLPGGGAAPTCFTDVDDTLAYFSNWGPEIDIAAPGGCILSTYPLSKTVTGLGTISGTSMASPHAAGALALLASANNPSDATDVDNLYNLVKSTGNLNWTDDSGDGIKERLLDVSTFDPVMVGETEPPDENVAPRANFTFDATGLTATFTDTSSDADGSVTSWNWNFGDGSTSTTQSPSHSYAAAGTYTVTLTVKDDDGAIGTTSQSVTVSTTVSP